jgi:hypothetical protein
MAEDNRGVTVRLAGNSTNILISQRNKLQWPQSATELYRRSDHRFSTKLVPGFAERRCRVVSATDPYGRNLGFFYRSRYYFYQVAPQLYSRGKVDPVLDPLLIRKSGSSGNWTQDLWICSQELWPLDHRGFQYPPNIILKASGVVRVLGYRSRGQGSIPVTTG